ncbi:MAG: molybdopterin converting factor subunit 1 [Pseudomonadota bacterium]
MSVRVLFFASLRDEVGTGELEVSLPASTGLRDFISRLGEHLSSDALDALRAENVRVAVNQDLISGELQINPGDEVAFLPPVTGG